MNEFLRQWDEYRQFVESHLTDPFPSAPVAEQRVRDAALYALTGGGKRIRPVMLLAGGRMLGLRTKDLLPFAVAMEMIHTYSLLHDDLPCMDDDDLRRGRPTCHIAFDEATAVLAGDALLNRAFELLLDACTKASDIAAARRIAAASGVDGMIGGQSADLYLESHEATSDLLRELHRKKTGALIHASLMVPFDLAGIRDERSEAMRVFAEYTGLVFQIGDDCLDASATAEELGKTPGKDAKSGKATYVTLYGEETARRMLHEEADKARAALEPLRSAGLDPSFFSDLITYLEKRKS